MNPKIKVGRSTRSISSVLFLGVCLKRAIMAAMATIEQIDPQWAWSEFVPSDAAIWNQRLAAHLFRRAGFGASASLIEQALKKTPGQVVTELLAGNLESKDFETQADALTKTVVAGGDPKQLASVWIYRLLYTPNQLLEKTTLLWHGHFATSAEKVQDAAMMWAQNQLLRRHALGSFEAMVQEIARDPAMLIYLDSASNRKAHPNENFSRELMELFCLGEGNYTEQDVQQLARCFTGWEIKNRQFRKNSYQHDNASKTVLGQTGDFDGEEAIRVVLGQEALPYFVVGKLVRFFVFDEPAASKELLRPLVEEFRRNGLQIGPIIKRILSSQLFFSEHAVARKIRSPVEMAIGFLRSMESTTNTVQLAEGLTKIGHGLFYPPNVKGWDGGRAWINSSTLLGRANLMQQILRSDTTRFAKISLEDFIAAQGATEGPDIVQWLANLLIAVPLSPAVLQRLTEVVGKKPTPASLRELLHAMSTLPEFQLT
jgi:Protein of unknown function (DUF1800)